MYLFVEFLSEMKINIKPVEKNELECIDFEIQIHFHVQFAHRPQTLSNVKEVH